MNETAPHYLLFTEAKNSDQARKNGGRWRFVLEQIGTTTRIEESDDEPGTWGERLQLLSVVRGLEALQQPSRITLITSSKYVGRGIRRSMTQWRENDWQWEHFGQMTPIKSHDLWKRIDQAMQIHQINCRVWQFEPPHVRTQNPRSAEQSRSENHPSPAIFKDERPNVSTPALALSSRHELFPQPFSSPTRNPQGSNRMTLSLKKGRSAIENTLTNISQVASMFEDKIKPIGQGRAYGYAVSL